MLEWLLILKHFLFPSVHKNSHKGPRDHTNLSVTQKEQLENIEIYYEEAGI